MLGFGCFNGFPLTLGGGDSDLEIEHEALLDALTPGWDSADGTANNAECYAHAMIVSMIWAVNSRVRNQAIPMRMLENLLVWEETLKLRPSRTDSAIERRKRVAARIRGIVNNAVVDIEDSAIAIFGDNFEQLVVVAPADEIVYWPGINPGPPGFEWSSNRAIIGIRTNMSGISEIDWQSKRASLADTLDAMLPAWMSFQIGIGSDWIVNEGILGETFL